MKRMEIFQILSIVFRILVSVGLIVMPSISWAQADTVLSSATSTNSDSTGSVLKGDSFVNSAWLRVGPSASEFSLYDFVQNLPSMASDVDSYNKALTTAAVLEKAEQDFGINSQVIFAIQLILERQSTTELSPEDLSEIASILDKYEIARAWGENPATALSLDGLNVPIPYDINPASAAVLAALTRHTLSQDADIFIKNRVWADKFSSIFQEYFGDPMDTPDHIAGTLAGEFKLPFNGTHNYNSGPHGGGSTRPCLSINTNDASGIDFDAPRVLSVSDGEVIAVQTGNLGSTIGRSVAVRTGGGQIVVMYWHLATVDPNLAKGDLIRQGTFIGTQGTGWNNAFSAHLHLELRTFNYSHDYLSLSKIGSPISWNLKSIDSYEIAAMFSKGSVLNYQGTAYSGSAKSTQFLNTTFPCGSSNPVDVSTYVSNEYADTTISNAYTHTKFADIHSNAGLQSTNREINICSVNEGVSAAGCDIPNRPPKVPILISPYDWYVQRDGRAATLCWNNQGDPDGDGVTFYAEVYESARNANSGWISSTCWRPSQLDGGYFGYKWRVKAKDSRGAESGWSSTWHFNIEPDNRPAEINFATANGNSSSEIATRDQNWNFTGTASDPEGQLRELRFHCHGDACNEDPTIALSGTWSYQRNGLSGRNEVWFTACDNIQCTDSRHVVLKIDLAAPATSADANGQTAPSDWFRVPVNVTLRALDGATGNAQVGVGEICYRVDSGVWQTQSGSQKVTTVSGDGNHTVEFYAIDTVGNQEGTKSISFKIDATAPEPPGSASDGNGVVSGQWQKVYNAPNFTWNAANDATSGVRLYNLELRTEQGVVLDGGTWRTATDRQYTRSPLATGSYLLRGQTQDYAGNTSPWVTMFTFRYDGTAPENPTTAAHTAGISNNTWQHVSNLADFSWLAANDEGSGVKGYYAYWGNDENGESTDFFTTAHLQSSTPLCATDSVCTGYLRLRSVDNVDLQAEKWSTLFTLRYDNAPPTVDLGFNGGVTETAQTLITLNINASDLGSGVEAMRFSSDGVTWSDWEAYATVRTWQLPPISREFWPVFAQVRDGVGLVSAVVSKEIYLDVNSRQSRSSNFRLFDQAWSAGAGAHTSSSFQAHSTVGQTVDSGFTGSSHFQMTGGYEAGSQAIPLIVPGHEEFNYINGIVASGVVAETMTSASFQMLGTVGEPGLPNNITTIASGNFQHQPGFLAAAPANQPTVVPMPTQTPGPTPPPPATPDCEFPQVLINNNAEFTYLTNVTLSLCAPHAVEMQVSNNENFSNTQWEPYGRNKAWTLLGSGQLVEPRFVYVMFRDADGTVHGTYFDELILDPNPPSGAINIGGNTVVNQLAQTAANADQVSDPPVPFEAKATVFLPLIQMSGSAIKSVVSPVVIRSAAADNTALDLFLSAQDDNSGLAEMQLSSTPDFSGASWEPYTALKSLPLTGDDGTKMLYVRFRDRSGNISETFDASYLLDSQPPLGGIDVVEEVIGSEAVQLHLYLDALDTLSGVESMRVSEGVSLAGAPWEPYASELIWPINVAPNETERVIYVQFRDLAGNVSQTYSDLFLVDRETPIVYAEADVAETLTRTVHIYAYDGLSSLSTLRLTNDPLFIENIVTLPYTDTVEWGFDERRVVWIEVEDGVGNWSEAYPVYAAASQPLVAPSITIINSGTDIHLSWTSDSVPQTYEVHRGATPFFAPDTNTLLVTLPAGSTAYADVGAAGNPAVSRFYAVRALNGGRSADSSQVGAVSYALNNTGAKYSLIALPFQSTTITNAKTLAASIGNVGALLKWNPATQTFRFFVPPSSGDNFALATGDAVFVLVNNGGPSVTTMVGNVTPVSFNLTRGGFNFVSLPMQSAIITNAAGTASNIGGVTALLSWNQQTQLFRFFAPPNSGDNFAVKPGTPFIVNLSGTGSLVWPQ